jgi:hypothetical protein
MGRKKYLHTNLPIITNSDTSILKNNLMCGLETTKLNSCSSLSSSNNSNKAALLVAEYGQQHLPNVNGDDDNNDGILNNIFIDNEDADGNNGLNNNIINNNHDDNDVDRLNNNSIIHGDDDDEGNNKLLLIMMKMHLSMN